MIINLNELSYTACTIPEHIVVNRNSNFTPAMYKDNTGYVVQLINYYQHNDHNTYIKFKTEKEAYDLLERIDRAMCYNELEHPEMFV